MNLQTITSSQFGQIRVQTIENEPWFVAKDICNSLGIKSSKGATRLLDEEDLRGFKTTSGSKNGIV